MEIKLDRKKIILRHLITKEEPQAEVTADELAEEE